MLCGPFAQHSVEVFPFLITMSYKILILLPQLLPMFLSLEMRILSRPFHCTSIDSDAR